MSSKDQNLERQREALAGVDVLVEEQLSGKNVTDREKLRTLMAFAQAGDTMSNDQNLWMVLGGVT